MVSHEQCSGTGTVITAVLTLAMLGLPAVAADSGPKFYPDDPLVREPTPRPVNQPPAARHVDDLYDFLYNSFHTPRHEHEVDKHGSHAALDANTIGDIPDSPWY